jgi:hypothetical protein
MEGGQWQCFSHGALQQTRLQLHHTLLLHLLPLASSYWCCDVPWLTVAWGVHALGFEQLEGVFAL